jgi:alkylation response protein AidB-like acyl-CoA dehydrogenase
MTLTAPAVHSGLSAELLDATLGDPWQAANPYGLAAAVARDAAAEYPHGFAETLHAAGFCVNYLGAELGGTMRSLEDTHVLVRTAARRDLNVMPATMFSISAVMTVLAVGTPEQRARVADWVRAGRVVAFALSEEHAGSDVLANSCRLSEVDGGYTLAGGKWLVGRGIAADAVLVVARTGERGPSAFTAVLLGPDELADPRVTRSAPIAMTGMRGVDFADLAFDDLPVPAAAVVGRVGQGLEGALRAQQVVRLMSTAGCLSTVDTALRVALRFARERRIGDGNLIDTPNARRELALAAAETLAADVTALAACRGIHAEPQRFGLASSVVKRIGTELTASAVARCGAVLGARAVVKDGLGAVLDKTARDNAMVKVIDTSPVGNLRAIAMQLPAYAKVPPEAADRLRVAFRFGEDLPALDPAALDLGARPRDDVVPGLLALADPVADSLAAQGDETAAGLVRTVRDQLRAILDDAAAAQLDRARSLKVATDLVDLADRFCLVYAAATAVLAWWFNTDRPLYGGAAGDAGWLTGVLAYLVARVADERPGSAVLAALDSIEGAHDAGLLFTALPVHLAEGPTDGSPLGDAT